MDKSLQQIIQKVTSPIILSFIKTSIADIETEIKEAWERYEEDYRYEYYDMCIPKIGEGLAKLLGIPVIDNGISRITFDLGDKVFKLEVTDEIMQNKNEASLYKDFNHLLPKLYYMSEDYTMAIFEKLRVLTKEDYEKSEVLSERADHFILGLLENNCAFWEIIDYRNGYLGLNQEGQLLLVDAGTFYQHHTLRPDFIRFRDELRNKLQVKGWT